MPNGQVNWQDLGWTGEAAESTGIQDLLGQFFATPEEYTQYFEDYDPTGEQAATQQMRLGQQAAQHQAQGSMWKQFEAGRQSRGGFGGAGRARQAAMGGIHKGLAQGREQAQLGLQEDIRGMHERYRGDVMSQIGQLFAGGAEGIGSGQQTGYDTSVYGSGFDETTGACQQGYYMAAQGSGQQGCIPIGGETEDEYVQNPDLTPEEQCAAKGGFWIQGVCEFPGSGGDGGDDDFDDTLP